MNRIHEAAQEIISFMQACNWKGCIVGGLAVQCWGEPRTTLDVDVTLLTGWGEEARFVRRLLEQFESRLSDGFEFAITRRVLLLRASNGCDMDILLGALPFEEAMIERAILREFDPGISLPVCSPEDLFIMKAFAARPRDWADIEGIIARQPRLDAHYILGHLTILCEAKNSPETVIRARRLLGVES